MDWRKSRTHGAGTAGHLERRLRLHAYPVIGQRTMRELGKRPSLIQSWIAGMQLAPGSARLVIWDVSAIFLALSFHWGLGPGGAPDVKSAPELGQ